MVRREHYSRYRGVTIYSCPWERPGYHLDGGPYCDTTCSHVGTIAAAHTMINRDLDLLGAHRRPTDLVASPNLKVRHP